MDNLSVKSDCVSQLIFSEYRIEKIHFALNPKFDFNDPIDIEFGLGAEIKILDDVSKAATISINCIIFKEPEDNNYPFTLEVKISGDFVFDGDIEDDKFLEFCKTSGFATLFPYLRSAITGITGITNVPSLVLPLINVKNLYESMKSQ